jgi:superfamily II DNA/RNA helicase
MAMQKQERLLSRHPHVVVATPGPCLPLLDLFSCRPANLAQLSHHLGRLWEFISNGHSYFASLHALRMVVIDEADRMLTSGHFKELQVMALLCRVLFIVTL